MGAELSIQPTKAAAETLRDAIDTALGYPIAGAPVVDRGIFAPQEQWAAEHHCAILYNKTTDAYAVAVDVDAKATDGDAGVGLKVTTPVDGDWKPPP